MVNHILFISFLILFSNRLFPQKFVEAYRSGNYEKSLSLAQKVIDKDPKNLDAYLIKALSNMHLATNQNTKSEYPSGIEFSISTLEFLKTKDKKNIYLPLHQKEVDSLVNTAFEHALFYFNDEKFSKSEKLADRLINIQPAPEYLFLKGKILIENGDLVGAIKIYNDAAAKIYLDSKSGKKPEPYLYEVFIELANSIYKDGDPASANAIFNRAAILFDNAEVDQEYYFMLRNQAGMMNNYTDWRIFDAFILNLDTIKSIVQNVDEIELLKWSVLMQYYEVMIDQDNFLKADSALLLHVCKENYTASIPFLIDKILTKTKIINSLDGTKIINAKNETSTLVSVYDCIANNQKKEFIMLEVIDSLLAKNIFADGIELLYNFSLVTLDKKKVLDYEDKIYKLINGASDSLAANIDMYVLSQYFPKNKNFKLLQKNAAINKIIKLMDNNKFSEAGELLRKQMLVNSNDATLRSLYKKWVINDYLANYNIENPWSKNSDWNGSAATCNPGKLSAEYQIKFLQRLNYFRRLAGVPDKSELKESWNIKCQEAALMMSAEGGLSHFPDKDWTCYTDNGAIGAGNSNLSLGAAGLSALLGQIDDSGDANFSVGHRRWILNPERKVFGHGSTDNSMAFWALGGDKSDYPDSIVEKYRTKYTVWPPEYFSPAEFYSARWSFSLESANFDDAIIEMYNGKQKINCEVLPLKNGYGPSTVVFEPDINTYYFDDETTITVIIKNVLIYSWDTSVSEGKYISKNYTYSTTFFRIE